MDNFNPLDKVILVHGSVNDRIENLLDYFTKRKKTVNETETPLMDLVVSKENIEIFAELPGVDLEDFNVLMYEGHLIIEGQKVSHRKHKKGNFLRMERSFFPFRRIIKLPYDVSEKDIDAKMKYGVLNIKIKLMKCEEGK